MPSHVLLTEEDYNVLKSLIEREKNNRQDPPKRISTEEGWGHGEDHQAPETYVVKPPSDGVPPLREEGSDTIPGSALCDIYQEQGLGEPDPTLGKIGQSVRVHNLEKTRRQGEFELATRTKFGTWVFPPSGLVTKWGIIRSGSGAGPYIVDFADLCESEEETGTGTGEAGSGTGSGDECGCPDSVDSLSDILTKTGESTSKAYWSGYPNLESGAACGLIKMPGEDCDGASGTGTGSESSQNEAYLIVSPEVSVSCFKVPIYDCCDEDGQQVFRHVSNHLYLIPGLTDEGSCDVDPCQTSSGSDGGGGGGGTGL